MPRSNRFITKLFSLLFLLWLSCPLHSQTYIGIQGGPTIGTMSGSAIQSSGGAELGFSMGLTIDRSFNEKYAFITGLQLFQKGSKKLVLVDGGSEEYSFSTSYLTIPLLLQRNFPIGKGAWNIGVFAGASINFNQGCDSKLGDDFEFDLDCKEINAIGDISGIDLSLPFGTTIWQKVGEESKLFFQLRYDVGLTGTFKETNINGGSIKSNSLYVGIIGFSYAFY